MKIKFVNFKNQFESVYKEGDIMIADHFFKEITGDVRFVTNLEQIEQAVNRISETKMDKDNKIIALGGGYTADVAALVAERLGVKWIYYPTTLVGCTCKNFGVKPSKIFCDINILKSMPFKELMNGFSLQALMHLDTVERYEFFKTKFWNKDELENVIKSTNKFDENDYKGIGMEFGMAIMKMNPEIPCYSAAIQGAIFSLIISLDAGICDEGLFSDIVGNCFSKFVGDFEYGPVELVEGMDMEEIDLVLFKNFGTYETRTFKKEELLEMLKK